MARLDGKVAIVTGGAHGNRAAIGSHYAKALAAEGAKVVVADIKSTDSVIDEIKTAGGEGSAMTVDVKSEQSVNDMVAKTIERYGRLDIVVNNAAIGSNIPPIPIEKMTVSEWDELMDINVRGPFLCNRAAVPQMKKQGYGKIVNIGSTTMVTGLPDRLHYVTAKGAILAMSRAMATELSPFGIRVNTISYGLITNPSVEEDFAQNPQKRQRMIESRALKMEVFPKDLVGTLVFLCAPDSDAMTGQCIIVDGGGSYSG